MSADLYELIALAARYFFAAMMLMIVLRAAYSAIEDSRRAARLRRLVPQTGLSGELVVLEPVGKIHVGMRYPVIREGMIGSSNRADVRIRDRSVRRRHAYFRLDDDGLHLRDHAGSRLKDASGKTVRETTLCDGDGVMVGEVKLMLVLNFADAFDMREEEPAPDEYDMDEYDQDAYDRDEYKQDAYDRDEDDMFFA